MRKATVLPSFFTISNLSRVWVKLDLYESEIRWIRKGQKVAFCGGGCPGTLAKLLSRKPEAKTETVSGTIASELHKLSFAS